MSVIFSVLAAIVTCFRFLQPLNVVLRLLIFDDFMVAPLIFEQLRNADSASTVFSGMYTSPCRFSHQ